MFSSWHIILMNKTLGQHHMVFWQNHLAILQTMARMLLLLDLCHETFSKVVANRVIRHISIRSQAKLKLPFLQCLFNQKEYHSNEDLSLNPVLLSTILLNAISLSNLVHFYTILDTFIGFYTLLCDFRTLSCGLEHFLTIPS